MPRVARQKSETGVYHVFLRGINRQSIFEETEDYTRFIDILAKSKDLSNFSLLSYCLMGNHVHLLIKVGSEDIGQSVKRIAGRYAAWFNWKYDRTGHLFQARFGSEPVETDMYLLAASRYIHLNPVKAKMCERAEDYEWSSYLDYVSDKTGLADIDLIKGLAQTFSNDWRSWFIDFTNTNNSDSFMDTEDLPILTDAVLRERVKKLPGVMLSDPCGMPSTQERDKAISILKKEGFGLRQIARVTGIPYGIVRSR